MRFVPLLLGILLLAPLARGAELGRPGDLLSLDVHAFVSQGFIVSTDNNYLADSTSGSFEFSEVGINFQKDLTDKLHLGLQLFAQDLGPIGNYAAKLDWYELDYRWKDWLGFRAGRVKIPFGLYNESSDIDAARIPILLPPSLYPAVNRNFLLAQTGVEVYGYVRLGRGGALDYRLYGGTIFIDLPPPVPSPAVITKISSPYLVGGRVLWETPIDGLRAGLSMQALRLDFEQVLTGGLKLNTRFPVSMWAASAEYTHKNWLLSAEYSQWTGRLYHDPAIIPNVRVVNERAYVMAAYRLTDRLSPSLYYSILYPNKDQRGTRADMQGDLAASLRIDLNPNWLLKFEGHWMRGTADVDPALNDDQPRSQLANNWAVFLVKTTVFF